MPLHRAVAFVSDDQAVTVAYQLSALLAETIAEVDAEGCVAAEVRTGDVRLVYCSFKIPLQVQPLVHHVIDRRLELEV